MNNQIDLNDGTHSRFDLEHIKTCDDCRRAHDDFIQDEKVSNEE